MGEGGEVQGAVRQALDLLDDGGVVLYVLAVLSIVAATIAVAKMAHFAAARIGARGFVDSVLEHWRAGRVSEARAAADKAPGPLARIMATAMAALSESALGEEKAREEVTRAASASLDGLRGWLPALGLIAALSPLIGLLGTVIGMIDAFQALEAAGNRVNPSILSGGIWVALLTTAAGLTVAIPALAIHHWLDGRVERCARAMEDAATRIFTLHTPAAH